MSNDLINFYQQRIEAMHEKIEELRSENFELKMELLKHEIK